MLSNTIMSKFHYIITILVKTHNITVLTINDRKSRYSKFLYTHTIRVDQSRYVTTHVQTRNYLPVKPQNEQYARDSLISLLIINYIGVVDISTASEITKV